MSIFGAGYVEQGVRNGTAYRLTLFRQAVMATNLLKLMLTNPAGSGVNMIVVSTTTDSYATVIGSISSFRSPTGNLPATPVTTAGNNLGIISPLNNNFSRPPLVTVLADNTVSTAGYTGGTMTQQKPMYTNGQTKSDETIVILKPGSVLAIQFGGAVALDFAYNLIWVEEAI